MSRATLPRPQVPVAGGLMPANEWYRYWADISINIDSVPDLEASIEGLSARVGELEGAGSAAATIRGNASVQATGSLKDGLVQLELQGDKVDLPAWHYYGTDALGSPRTFVEFPANLQAVAGLSGAGFTARESDGTWAQYTFGGLNGIVVGQDGAVVTITGNPYFAAVDDPTGDFNQGPAIATHEQSVALGSGTNTDGNYQVAIGPRSIRMNGHTLSATAGGLLYDGAPIGGGVFSRNIAVISSNTSAGAAVGVDYIYLASAPLTLTLPAAASNSSLYCVKNSSAGTIFVASTGGSTIDGAASPVSMPISGMALSLISDGTNWVIL